MKTWTSMEGEDESGDVYPSVPGSRSLCDSVYNIVYNIAVRAIWYSNHNNNMRLSCSLTMVLTILPHVTTCC